VNKRNNASADVRMLATGASISRVPFQDYKFGENVQNGDQVVVGFVDRDPKKPFIVGHGGHAVRRSTEKQATSAQWYSPYCDSGRTRINDNGGAYYNFSLDGAWRSPEHAAYTIPESYNPEKKQFMAQYSTSPQGLIAFTSEKYGGIIATSYYRASGPLQYVDIALSLMDHADEETAIAPEIVITISGTWRDGRSLVRPEEEDVSVEPTRKMAFDEVRKELVVYFGLYDNRIVRINAATCELKSNQVLSTETKLMAGYDGDHIYRDITTPFYSFRPAELFATNGYILGEQRYTTTPYYSGGTIGLERTIDPIEIPIWGTPKGATTLRFIRTISFFPPVLEDFKKQVGHTPVGWNGSTPVTIEVLGAQIQYCMRVVGDVLHIGYSFHGYKEIIQNYKTNPGEPEELLDMAASGIISRVVGIYRYSISTGSLLSTVEAFREDKSYNYSPLILVPKFISGNFRTPEDALAGTIYYDAFVQTQYRHTETYIQDFCVDPSGTQHLLYGFTSHTGEEFSLANAVDKYARGESTYTSSFCRKLAVYDKDNKQLYSGYADAPSAAYTEWWGAGAVRAMSGSIGNPIFTPKTRLPRHTDWPPATCRVIGDTLAINPTISSSIRVHGKISDPRLSHLTDFGYELSYRDLPTTMPCGNAEGEEAAGYSIVGGAIPKDSVYPILVLLVCGNYVPPSGFPSYLTGERYYAKGGVRTRVIFGNTVYYNSIYEVLVGSGAYIPFPPQDYLPLHGYTGLAYWVSIRTDTMTITGRSEAFLYTRYSEGDGIFFSRVMAANMVAFTAGKMYHPTILEGKWQMVRRT